MTVFEWLAIGVVCLVTAVLSVSSWNKRDNVLALLILLIGLIAVLLLSDIFATP